jgi:hypothetical protein
MPKYSAGRELSEVELFQFLSESFILSKILSTVIKNIYDEVETDSQYLYFHYLYWLLILIIIKQEEDV